MGEEQDAIERAKQLISLNRQQTRELFGSRHDAHVLQFPVKASEDGPVDLGLDKLYGRGRYCRSEQNSEQPVRKRPRTGGVQGNENGEGDAVGRGSGQAMNGVDRGVGGKEDGVNGRNGNENGREETNAQEGQAAETSRALVPAASEEQALSLSARDVSASLALDRPQWHPPWILYRTISSHLGWVRSVAVDKSNEWFVTGSADRTVKMFDVASGRLKLTLTGHISTVRGIAISDRHPYMFTVGEDKTVKCWDLEQNKVIRNYHGHLSGVYCVSLHPTLDVLMTGGRDSTVRVWDIRTRAQIFVLGGHRDTVNAVISQADDPQIVSGSVDSTVRLWDLAAGKCLATLTNHKKGVRALARHPREFGFASAAADHIKTWGLPQGVFMRNLSGHDGLVNALAVNEDGVLVSGGDDGVIKFWDWGGAHCFQTLKTVVQPGSLDCEAGIFALSFDQSGSRVISCEADKTIKMWKEDEQATEDTHPLNWKPDLHRKRY